MPIKAKTNIVCFKVLSKYKHKTGWKEYQTPIMHMPVRMYNEIYAKGDNKLPYPPNAHRSSGIVAEGFIHAFTSKEKAQEWKQDRIIPDRLIIVRCIIPKNTLYYISKDKDQICAKCIKPIHIIA